MAEYFSCALYFLKFAWLRRQEKRAAPQIPIEAINQEVEDEKATLSLLGVVRQSLTVFTRTFLYNLLLLAASVGLAARAGPLDLAAHQVALQLWLLPTCLLDALAIAGQVGGEKKWDYGSSIARQLS